MSKRQLQGDTASTHPEVVCLVYKGVIAVYERFLTIMKEKGLTLADVQKRTGISSSTLSCWKAGKYTPKIDKLQKIADCLGVSLEFLISDSKNEENPYKKSSSNEDTFSKEEKEEIEALIIYRQLNEDDKSKLLNFGRLLAGESLSVREQKMLSVFRKLNEIDQDEMINFAKFKYWKNKNGGKI